MPLTDIIIDRIRKEGPISFRDFMEMALYYPAQGYYTSAGDKIGPSGDFYTSPYLSSLFGEMLAGQFEEMWQLLDRQPFTIVEQGAGSGLLCLDILSRLQSNPALYDRLNYIIVEKSGPMRPPRIAHPKLTWTNSIHDLPPITGCIFSNELIDNFSIHQVVMQEELMEVFVDYRDGFVETLQPAGPALKDYLHELMVTLPAGFRTEINLEATEWIATISNTLQKGFVMTIDYGYPSSDLYSLNKKAGTLVCYHRHQVNYRPYENVGEQDITTHVNFSALDHWGTTSGLEQCGYTNQAFFLRGLGLARHLRQLEEKNIAAAASPAAASAICEQLLLLHNQLMKMGDKFKVLIQQKGLRKTFLSGLQFPQRLV
jgi:SAM-dependent MidA family methyltransferase